MYNRRERSAGRPAITRKPAVFPHREPGSGVTPFWRRFFDPVRHRAVLLDQPGCGRSLANAADDLAANGSGSV
jgi:proline iminopeptidase